jgi:hypothetical protein
MDKLDGSFIRGYTKALLDIQNFFESHSEALSTYKLFNKNGVTAILKFLIENRDELREYGNIEEILVRKEPKKIIITKRSE